jgi:predicted DsbA family dithiol-disulfide isomerase
MPSLHIDFISDISCPWCAIGLSSLQLAMAQLAGEVDITLRCQPFELNPDMPPGGQDITEHLRWKYGSTPEQQAQMREVIRQRGAEVGFTFHPDGRGRIYNTFNAHRLLHWTAVAHAAQHLPFKQALLVACHQHQQPMDELSTLLACVREAGLNEHEARELLATDRYVDEVRLQQAFYADAGIRSVPALVVNEQHLITGSQSVEHYVAAMRQIQSSASSSLHE